MSTGETRPEDGGDARLAAESVARRSYGKLVAFLSARSRDVAGAEDALSEAFAAALVEWPRHGAPDNPEAWLMAVAKRRRIDAMRRHASAQAAAPQLEMIAQELEAAAASAQEIPDDRLRLMFACAHPAIDEAIRAPLMLQTILGFDAAAIASAFLVSPTAMGQRLSRAKTRIRQAGIPFRLPERHELGGRLDAVLAAIYATFAEGWSDPAGTDARRRNLAGEGIWLGRLAASLLPDAPEALGLLALMLLHDSRRATRVGTDGALVPLEEQDRSRWDLAAIAEGRCLLDAALAMRRRGPYQVQAAIAALHAGAATAADTDWPQIAALYGGLMHEQPGAVVELNAAVAVAMAEGPARGLELLARIGGSAELAGYHLLPAARADLLRRLGRHADAAIAYGAALTLVKNRAERLYLERRLAACLGP